MRLPRDVSNKRSYSARTHDPLRKHIHVKIARAGTEVNPKRAQLIFELIARRVSCYLARRPG